MALSDLFVDDARRFRVNALAVQVEAKAAEFVALLATLRQEITQLPAEDQATATAAVDAFIADQSGVKILDAVVAAEAERVASVSAEPVEEIKI